MCRANATGARPSATTGRTLCASTPARCAIEFGDVDELRAAHGEGLVSELPVLPSADETSPNLLIRAKEQAYVQPCRRAIV